MISPNFPFGETSKNNIKTKENFDPFLQRSHRGLNSVKIIVFHETDRSLGRGNLKEVKRTSIKRSSLFHFKFQEVKCISICKHENEETIQEKEGI